MPVDVVTEIEIARPRPDVAAYACDPDHATEWYENIKAVEWKSPPPLGVGSRLAFVAAFLGRRLEYTYEVRELVPGERFVMSTAEGPFPMETTYSWSDAANGATKMTLRNRGQPAGFAKIAAPVMAIAMRRANRKDLRRLKATLEDPASLKPSGLPVEGTRMTFEQQTFLATTKNAEPRGIQLTEETFEPSGLVLTVEGELDIATAPALRERLDAAIKAGKHRLVIDLSAVSFLDSVAIATIVHAKQRLPEDGRLALAVDPSSYVMLVFEGTGLPKVLDLVETRAQAIQHVSS